MGLDDEDRYDFVPVPCLTVDLSGRIRESNLAAAALFGVERGQLTGQLLADIVAHEGRSALVEHLGRCMGQRLKTTSELTVSVHAGVPLTIQMVSAPIVDAAGAVVGARAALVDISVRKVAEDKLRVLADASRAMGSSFDYAAALDRVAKLVVPMIADVCAIDIVDPDGALRRVGVAYARPNDRVLLASFDGGAGRVAWVSRSSEPTMIDLAAGATALLVPILARDRVQGAITLMATGSERGLGALEVVMGQDLAARATMAIERAQLYEEAQRAIRGRQDLLSFVSHDLRNPLMAVSLTTDLLLRSKPSDGQSERRRSWSQIERIRCGIAQMRRMVEDLSDLASIEAGRLATSMAEHELGAVLRESVDLLAPVAAQKQVDLSVDWREPSAIRVRCDRARVLQVLSNVVGNAIKLTAERGRVTVRAVEAGGHALVTVRDTGAGMSQETKQHLFERFWQGDPSSRTGSGLGLYIAKQIIEAHGGSIWADSELGVGSTLHFTLPIARPYSVDDDGDLAAALTTGRSTARPPKSPATGRAS